MAAVASLASRVWTRWHSSPKGWSLPRVGLRRVSCSWSPPAHQHQTQARVEPHADSLLTHGLPCVGAGGSHTRGGGRVLGLGVLHREYVPSGGADLQCCSVHFEFRASCEAPHIHWKLARRRVRWAARGLRALCSCARRSRVARWTRTATGPDGARYVILAAVLCACARELAESECGSALCTPKWTLADTQFSASATLKKY